MVEDTGRAGGADWPAPAWLESNDTVLVPHRGRAGPARRRARRRHASGRRGPSPQARCSTPSRVGALAAMGLDRVEVFARPLVAMLPTGNEVVAPGTAAARGVRLRRQQLHARRAGPAPRRHARAAAAGARHRRRGAPRALDAAQRMPFGRRRRDARAGRLRRPRGGSSVGERDLIDRRGARAGRGAVPRHRGQAGQADAARDRSADQIVLGMPGNPTSCLSNAHVLLVPALRAARAAAAGGRRATALPPDRRACARRATAISSCRCASRATRRRRCSRARARSRACRERTATWRLRWASATSTPAPR